LNKPLVHPSAPRKQAAQQQLRIDTIGFGSTSTPVDWDARGLDDMHFDVSQR
jgi:hypothetical protein